MVLTQHLEANGERELSLQMLSDGYRTMLALVMDFARRMAQANPHLDKPLEAEAILRSMRLTCICIQSGSRR